MQRTNPGPSLYPSIPLCLSSSLTPLRSTPKTLSLSLSRTTTMQVASSARRITRFLQTPSILLYSEHRLQTPLAEAPHSSLQQHRNHSALSFSGIFTDDIVSFEFTILLSRKCPRNVQLNVNTRIGNTWKKIKSEPSMFQCIHN